MSASEACPSCGRPNSLVRDAHGFWYEALPGLRRDAPRVDNHPLGARNPGIGSLHEGNELSHALRGIADEIERTRRQDT